MARIWRIDAVADLASKYETAIKQDPVTHRDHWVFWKIEEQR